jgi:hypothetical protein
MEVSCLHSDISMCALETRVFFKVLPASQSLVSLHDKHGMHRLHQILLLPRPIRHPHNLPVIRFRQWCRIVNNVRPGILRHKLRGTEPGKVVVAVIRVHRLGRLILEASLATRRFLALFPEFLGAGEHVAGQGFAGAEVWVVGRVVARLEGCGEEGPAAADPVAVASVDQLVGAAGEAGVGGFLPGGEPACQGFCVEMPVVFRTKRLCRWSTYFGIMVTGSPRIDKHASPQKA